MIQRLSLVFFYLFIFQLNCFSQEKIDSLSSDSINADFNVIPNDTLKQTSIVSRYDPNSAPKKYILRSLSIEGVKKYTPKQILLFTGLKIGSEIELPGGKALSNAIKKLWRTHLFSDIQFFVNTIARNQVDLKVKLIDLPLLNEVESDGISKGKLEDFMEEVGLIDLEEDKKFRLSNDLRSQLRYKIITHFTEKGYPDAKVDYSQKALDDNLINLKVSAKKGPRVKIRKINFYGNNEVSDKKLRSNKVFNKTK